MNSLKKNTGRFGIIIIALMAGISGLVFSPLLSGSGLQPEPDSANDTTMEFVEETNKIYEEDEVVFPLDSQNSKYLTIGVLEHTFAHGQNTNYDHITGIAYNPATNTYWTVDGGGESTSFIYEYRENGTIVTSGTVPLDARAIVYRPKDGNIYISSFPQNSASGDPGDIYRLNLPFNGTVALIHKGILQNRQCGFTFADDGNIFDFYDGNVREYNFATGAILKTFPLNPNFPSGGTYPYNVQIAGDGSDLYFLSSVDDVFVYDIDGIYQAAIDMNHPSLDEFEAPFSFSYANERVYIHDNSDHLIYGYRVDAGCTLDMDLSLSGDIITLDFIIGTMVPATWSVWSSFQDDSELLYSEELQVTDPPINKTLQFSGFSQKDGAVISTTLTTPNEGEICSDYTSVSDGLVAYYPFNGNADDESGNGNHGTVNGATLTTGRFGNPDNAYSFDGVDDYIEVQDDDSLDLISSLTIAAWINFPIQDSPTTTGVVGKGINVNGSGYRLGVSVDKVGFGLNADTSNDGDPFFNCAIFTVSFFTNEWVYATATWDGFIMKLFINGQLQSIDDSCTTFSLLNNSEALNIGRGTSGLIERYFKGYVDNVRIYNRALSESEIQELYNEESCFYSISPTSETFPSNGGSGAVNVTADVGCDWTAVSNDGWITITSGNSGSGDGTVTYSIDPNTGASTRTGTMTIAGETFTVTQATACFSEGTIEILSIDPPEGTILEIGNTFTFTASVIYSFDTETSGHIGINAYDTESFRILDNQTQNGVYVFSQSGEETVSVTTKISLDGNPVNGVGISVSLLPDLLGCSYVVDVVNYATTASNTSPTAAITSPTDGDTYTEGDSITFTGKGTDAEDGDLTGDSLVWTSGIDGEIGIGASFTRSDLSAETHTITLTATDSEGATDFDTVTITVNTPPIAAITSPTDGDVYTEGDLITFTGTGVDVEDGNLTGNSLVWTSSIDGEIGTGASFSRNDLAAGTHTITLTATDSEGATGSGSIDTIDINIIISEGLVAYYPFNGNANDESGNGNNGTVIGATLATDRFGNPDSAYEFDGDDYMSTNMMPDNIFSMSLWYLASDSQKENAGIASTYSTSHYYGFYYMHGGSWEGIRWDNNAIQSYSPIVDEWVHLVIVSNGSKITVYRNNAITLEVTGTTTHSDILFLGTSRFNGKYFTGTIDDVRIYNRALSKSEIQELYNGFEVTIGSRIYLGAEIKVNDAVTNTEELSTITVLSDNRFVVGWLRGTPTDTYGKIYNPDGQQLSSEFILNPFNTSGWEYGQALASLPSGRFVVTWGDSSTWVYAQIFDANGNAEGVDFLVATKNVWPTISSAPNGDFVVVWGRTAYGIQARRYNSAGTPYGNIFQVNTNPLGFSTDQLALAAVASANDGAFCIVWRNADGNIYGQRYDNSGNKAGGEFTVNTSTGGSRYDPTITYNSANKFSVAWSGSGAADPSGIYARQFLVDGTPLGDEWRVNDVTVGAQSEPHIGSSPSGEFVIAWNGDDGSSSGVFAHLYGEDGTSIGAEIQVNQYVSGSQALAWNSRTGVTIVDDMLTFTWYGEGSGVQKGVYLTTLKPTSVNAAPTFTSTPVTTVNEDASYTYNITTTDDVVTNNPVGPEGLNY